MPWWGPITEITPLSGVGLITLFPLPTAATETTLRFESCLVFFVFSDLATAFLVDLVTGNACISRWVKLYLPCLLLVVGSLGLTGLAQGLHMVAKTDHRVSQPFAFLQGRCGFSLLSAPIR